MITLDTSVVLAAIDAKDRDHSRVIDMLVRERGPYILPVAILSEITFVIEQELGNRMLEEFLRTCANRSPSGTGRAQDVRSYEKVFRLSV